MHIEKIDYDLAVASFLQETHHLNLPEIPISVDRVLLDFTILRPLTMTQEQLRDCAAHIRNIIDKYLENPDPDFEPFALRYPTLDALMAMASQRAACPRPLPSGVAVLLLDESNRMLALGIPPKVHKENPTHLPGEVGISTALYLSPSREIQCDFQLINMNHFIYFRNGLQRPSSERP